MATTNSDDSKDLLQSIERALSSLGAIPTLEPELDRRFELDRGAQRCREILLSSLIGLAVYNAFLVVDAVLVPDVFRFALLMRLAIVTPLVLVLLVIVTQRPPERIREGAAFTMTILVAGGLAWIAAQSHAPLISHYQYGIALVLIFTNVVLQLRFTYAVIASLLQVGLYALAASATVVDPRVRLAGALLVGSAAIFTLFANWRLNRNERVTFLLSLRDRIRTRELWQQNMMLHELSGLDPLTGLANRRLFDEQIASIWRRALISAEEVGLLMVDVDYFKAFNDRYGHVSGDECLRLVAESLKREVRASTDCLARYGGEEFVVSLPGLDLEACFDVANRMRQAIEDLGLPHEGSPGIGRVTISVGVATRRADPSVTVSDLVHSADKAMYRAKRRGRNRVQAAPALDGSTWPRSEPPMPNF